MNVPPRGELRRALLVLSVMGLCALPAVAQRPELMIQNGHRGIIRALALSKDKKLLASAGADKTIILWNLAAEKQIASLTGHEGWIFALSFSPDTKFLASGSYDGMVKVWNLSSAEIEFEISALRPHNVTSLAFSPDGDTLAIATSDKTISLWDMQARGMKPPLIGHSAGVTQIEFRPDGKTLVSSSMDKTMRFWDLSAKRSWRTGALPRGITGFAYSPSGRFVAVNIEEGTIAVQEAGEHSRPVKSKVAIRPQKAPGPDDYMLEYRHWQRLVAPRYAAGSTVFISDNELVTLDSFKLQSWDVETNKEKLSEEIKNERGAYAAVVDRDSHLLIYSDGVDIKLLDLVTQKRRKLQGGFSMLLSVAFSPDGNTLAGAFDGGFDYKIWGRKINDPWDEFAVAAQLLSAYTAYVPSLKLLTMFYRGREEESRAADILLTDIDSETEFLLKGHTGAVTSITVNKAENVLASSSQDGTIKFWDLKTRTLEKTLKESAEKIQFSPDGKLLAAQSESGKIKLLHVDDLTKPPVQIDLSGPDQMMLFSPNGEILAGTSADKFRAIELKLWKVSTGELLHTLNLAAAPKTTEQTDLKSTSEPNIAGRMWQVGSSINSYKTATGPIAFSPDGSLIVCEEVVSSPGINRLKVWDVATGKELHNLTGHTDSIRSVAFSSSGKILASVSWDTTLRLWNPRTGDELATLIPFDKDNWVIATPAGQFDTSLDLYDRGRLSWTWPTDPFNPLSVRVFMRDYFEPKLLQRILAGETLNPVRDLSTLNRTQPALSIKDVRADGPGTVQVTVEVAESVSKTQTDAGGSPMRSGAFDLRLLRDGQVVASSTTDEAFSNYITESALSGSARAFDRQELELWQRSHKVKLDAQGKATLIFRHIKSPQRKPGESVSFSAYAFNSDRVTSETTPPYLYKLLPPTTQVKPRAYVITVGVDANQSGWNLDFMAGSAEGMRRVLGNKLSGRFDVVNVSLLSTLEPDSPSVALAQATKENIRMVLDILAGRAVSATRLEKIPNAEALRAATPDDLVVLYIASHGYADRYGNFYLIPYDTGSPAGVTETVLNDCLGGTKRQKRCTDARNFLGRSISGDELSAWWRVVDAGEMVMILDSCYSAALPGRSFKPGPLGDRNFGQLAYDKGMLILAATQPNKFALSVRRKGVSGTLLSSALLSTVKTNPRQTLSEWMEAAESKVPELYRKLYPEMGDDEVQLPSLLDFTKRRRTAAPAR